MRSIDKINLVDGVIDDILCCHDSSIMKARGTTLPYVKELLQVLLNGWGEASQKAIKKSVSKLNAVKGILGHEDIHNVTELLRETINVAFQKNTAAGVPVLFDKAYIAGKRQIVDKLGLYMKWESVDEMAIQWLENHHMYWVDNFYDKHVSAALSRHVSEGMQQGLGRKEIGSRLKSFFDTYVGVANKPESYWRGFAANGMNRARNFGLVQGYDDAGIKYLEVLAVMDERTSSICRNLNGKRYPVWSAVAQRDMMMFAENPEDIKVLSPWPKVSDIVTNGKVNSVSSLIGSGIIMPPYHFHCRTTMVEVY